MEDLLMEDLPMPDSSFETADLLVRCSGVPFARISSVLGFEEPERFSQWFEGRSVPTAVEVEK